MDALPQLDEQLDLRSTRGRIALGATVAASAMASLDATIVNVALPHIGHDLEASVSQLQWVLTGYLLALASLILLAGALGDRWGRRRVFVLGTVWFAAASLVCGVAPSIEVLIAARVLQGVGGALLTPGSLAIIQASFRADDRARAVGAWSGLGGVAGAIGPFVGGLVVGGPGWRWAFLLNLPVAAGVVLSARAAVPETKDPHAAQRIDLPGALYAVTALASATWGLSEAGPRGWTSPIVIGALVVAALAMAWFVAHVRRSDHPLVPPSLFRDRTFAVVNLGTVFLYASIGLTFFLVAYELQVAAGWNALEAGVAMLPTTLLMLLFSARSGALAQRLGPKLQLTVGPLVTAAGFLAAHPYRLRPALAHRRVPWCDRPRLRTRHLRRSPDRNGDGCRRPRPRERRVWRQQRGRSHGQPRRARRRARGVRPHRGDGHERSDRRVPLGARDRGGGGRRSVTRHAHRPTWIGALAAHRAQASLRRGRAADSA